MVYRGDESKMSGYAHEWVEAQKKMPKTSCSNQLLCAKDEMFRLSLVEEWMRTEGNQGSELMFSRLGIVGHWSGQGDLKYHLPGLEVEWGKIVVDSERATVVQGFIWWRCINGGKEVVNAVADGDVEPKQFQDLSQEEIK